MNGRPRHKQRLGSRASDREELDFQTGTVETFLEVQNDLTSFYPVQMVPGAGHLAFDKTDGEDINMPRCDL